MLQDIHALLRAFTALHNYLAKMSTPLRTDYNMRHACAGRQTG
jgi:hypothetical protein